MVRMLILHAYRPPRVHGDQATDKSIDDYVLNFTDVPFESSGDTARSPAAVPEPTAMLLACVAALMLPRPLRV